MMTTNKIDLGSTATNTWWRRSRRRCASDQRDIWRCAAAHGKDWRWDGLVRAKGLHYRGARSFAIRW